MKGQRREQASVRTERRDKEENEKESKLKGIINESKNKRKRRGLAERGYGSEGIESIKAKRNAP